MDDSISIQNVIVKALPQRMGFTNIDTAKDVGKREKIRKLEDLEIEN
ncbi:MAG: hypothetical protein R2827_06480 [Bdellovibrionales bacterium]